MTRLTAQVTVNTRRVTTYLMWLRVRLAIGTVFVRFGLWLSGPLTCTVEIDEEKLVNDVMRHITLHTETVRMETDTVGI